MTKKVRVENADTSSFKLIVEVWDKGMDGQPDKLAETKPLNNPADLLEVYITNTRYLRIAEAP